MGKIIAAALALALITGCTYRRYEMPITVINGRVPVVDEEAKEGATVITVPPSANNGNQLTLYLYIQADVPKHIQAQAEAEVDGSLLPKLP